MKRLLPITVCLTLLMGCSSMKRGNYARIAPTTQSDRVGSVYLLRGFIGIFSTGIDHLGERLSDGGVNAEVFQDDQWSSLANNIVLKYQGESSHEPIVLVGHSYGADDVIRVARKLDEKKIEVALLITLDPVTPPRIPGNVVQCVNLYQTNGAMDKMPWLRGIPVRPAGSQTHLQNIDIRRERPDLMEGSLDHFNIEKKEKIQDEVIARVLQVCEDRPTYFARHRSASLATAATTAPAVDSRALSLESSRLETPRDVSGSNRRPARDGRQWLTGFSD